jgi:hypothetical protein
MKIRVVAFAAFAGPFVLAACSSRPGDSTSQAAEAVGAGHVDATNCEIFIDKIQPILDSHGEHEEVVYIKTLNFRLDAPIAEVGFRYTVHDVDHDCDVDSGFAREGCEEVGRWQDAKALRFQEAQDYFSIGLDLGNDFTFEHQYEGVFFVRTMRGTNYWFKTPGKQNFFIDARGLEDVMNGLRSRGYDNFFSSADITTAPVTADYYTYLNPDHCR